MIRKLGVGKIKRDIHDIKKLVKRTYIAYNFQDLNLKVKSDTCTIKGIHTTFKTYGEGHK
jgi:hypothetical protein